MSMFCDIPFDLKCYILNMLDIFHRFKFILVSNSFAKCVKHIDADIFNDDFKMGAYLKAVVRSDLPKEGLTINMMRYAALMGLENLFKPSSFRDDKLAIYTCSSGNMRLMLMNLRESPKSVFRAACHCGIELIVEIALEHNLVVPEPTDIKAAFNQGHLGIVNMLLESNKRLFHSVCESGHIDLVKYVLSRTNTLGTELFQAAFHNMRVDVMELILLSCEVDLDSILSLIRKVEAIYPTFISLASPSTTLKYSCYYDDVSLLLSSINDGATPDAGLSIACKHDSINVFNILVYQHHIPLTNTNIHLAIINNSIKIIKHLLDLSLCTIYDLSIASLIIIAPSSDPTYLLTKAIDCNNLELLKIATFNGATISKRQFIGHYKRLRMELVIHLWDYVV